MLDLWKPEECFVLFFFFFHSFGEFLPQIYKKRKKEVHLHIDSLSDDWLLFQLLLLLLPRGKPKRTKELGGRKRNLQTCGGGVCVFNFRDTVRMRIVKDRRTGNEKSNEKHSRATLNFDENFKKR